MVLSQRIALLLAGKRPEIQGAALADLLAIYLAGHRVEGDPAATNRLREELLAMHVEQVRQLIEPNARAFPVRRITDDRS
jgi:hypothetical protein